MTVYLNTYKTWQVYSGPEEGGWWYECGAPVQSVFVSDMDYEDWLNTVSDEDHFAMRNGATLRYTNGQAPTPIKNGQGGYSFMVGDDTPTTYAEENSYHSCFEEEFAQPYTPNLLLMRAKTR